MLVVSDPVFDEVELTGSAPELAHVANMVAAGEGFVDSLPATAPGGDSLTGVEVADTPGPGVLIRLDSDREILVISGDPTARALLAEQLHAVTEAMAAQPGGGHRHVDHYPGHRYLVEGSVPLVLGVTQ